MHGDIVVNVAVVRMAGDSEFDRAVKKRGQKRAVRKAFARKVEFRGAAAVERGYDVRIACTSVKRRNIQKMIKFVAVEIRRFVHAAAHDKQILYPFVFHYNIGDGARSERYDVQRIRAFLYPVGKADNRHVRRRRRENIAHTVLAVNTRKFRPRLR